MFLFPQIAVLNTLEELGDISLTVRPLVGASGKKTFAVRGQDRVAPTKVFLRRILESLNILTC